MIILPISSSNKGLNEDETGAGRLFPDAARHVLPKVISAHDK
jgi:hypothetical protein